MEGGAVEHAGSESVAVEHVILDCRTCGACCMPEIRSPFYVRTMAEDLQRMTRQFRASRVSRWSLLTKLDPAGRCVCVALQGTVGRRVSCRIYERRPNACRRLRLGSAACRKARRQAGMPGIEDGEGRDRGGPPRSGPVTV